MQNRHFGSLLGKSFAIVAAVAGLGSNLGCNGLPSVQAHQIEQEPHDGCSIATLKGGYGLSFQGFGTRGAVPALVGAFLPAAGVGLMTFDGKGSLTLVETTSAGGKVGPLSATGTYTVNADCTGSLDAPGAATWNFIIVHDGKQMLAINTIEGRVAPVNLEKL